MDQQVEMENHFPARIALILSIFLAVPFDALPASAESSGNGWDVIEVGGRDYVSVLSLKSFYGFTNLTRTGKNVVLENDKVEIKLSVGGNECLMNNVKFVFSPSASSLTSETFPLSNIT